MPLVIKGRILAMSAADPDASFVGRVFLNDDGLVDAVTAGNATAPAGFANAPVVDVGTAWVLPGLIDLHNHVAYNALPLWAEPSQSTPFRHHNSWTDAPTYRSAIGWPSWVLAKADPEALLAYVQTRALVGGTTAIQGWPAFNRPPLTVLRSIDNEKAGSTTRNLIYTSALTQTPLQLARMAQQMDRGAGFIYHCSEGQRGSVVAQEFSDAASAGCLTHTFVGIHCNAVPDADWIRWPSAAPGAIVWSPFSNVWLYGSTTNIPQARARGVSICLGSDWGPSGTKHVLAELKVARIVADAQQFALSDRELVSMVTSTAGDVLARCWSRQAGRLVPGAFGDVVVLRSTASTSVWSQILRATERDVMLVVVGGRARYGDAAIMTDAGALTSETLTVRGVTKRLSMPNPEDVTTAWKWRDIVSRLDRVRQDPVAALRRAEGRRRAFAGPMNAQDAPLELALDMPAGPSAVAGPPPRPADVVIPKLPTLVHDAGYFASIRGQGFHGGLLDGLADFYQ